MLKSNNSYGFRILKMLVLVLSSALFISVSCTSIEITLVKLDIPVENVDPNSPYSPSFFRVATISNGRIDYALACLLALYGVGKIVHNKV